MLSPVVSQLSVTDVYRYAKMEEFAQTFLDVLHANVHSTIPDTTVMVSAHNRNQHVILHTYGCVESITLSLKHTV